MICERIEAPRNWQLRLPVSASPRYTWRLEKGGPVTEKNVENAKTAGRKKYRPGPFTRINLILGVFAYSLLPLLAQWTAIHAHRITFDDWKVIVGEVVFLQIALWFATKRCSSEKFSF